MNKPVITKDIMKEKLRELQKRLLRPVTKENVFYHYLPMFGVKSYLELSLNVFNPSLISQIYKRYKICFVILRVRSHSIINV